MTTREQLATSCETAVDYPKNLIRHNTYEHKINTYFERLNEREDRLFNNKDEAAIDFWEFDVHGKAFWHNRVRDASELKKQLRVACLPEREDPRCRFVFVHAPHSRERLRTSREMLMLIFTYHQVMPDFLDFVFPFGKQQYAQDFHFSGFRHDTRLSGCQQNLSIPELGWSGRDLQLCYNLKSVEPSKSQSKWPWSIRQSAVYHAFDIGSSRATWIVMKGDQLMKNRIKSATGTRGLPEVSSFETVDRAFASTLATHMLLCDWSSEHWRWYINFLEEELQATTRRILSVTVKEFLSPTSEEYPSPITQRSLTQMTQMTGRLASPASEKAAARSCEVIKEKSPGVPALPTDMPTFPELPIGSPDQPQAGSQPEFSFSDLQRIQFIEEKANETLLVLKANITVLTELRQHYRSLLESENWPPELGLKCKCEIERFEKRVSHIENDLRMQQSRTETLLRLLADRKSLLYGILQHQSMEVSKLLASRAQLSADNMEEMTRDMHEIAHKTKQETISVRIITFVTLFFLPGTFISTLMSTDIVHFETTSTGKSGKIVQMGALQLYLAISLPLMLLTLLAWYGVYWWETRKGEKERSKGAHLKLEA